MKKRSKILAAAIAMMTLSTAASITGTVAWFTANNQVSASGMNLQADVENGIVIANETHTSDDHWLTNVTASHNGQVSSTQQAFVATSTANCSAWYHANSASANNHEHSGAYTTLSVTAPTEISGTGIGTTTTLGGTKNVYLKNSFYIQAAAQTPIDDQDIYLTDLSVSGNTSSPELDKALRLAVVYDGNATIFGVVDGFTTSYTVNGATATAANNASGENKVDVATNVDIPTYTTTGTSALKFDVYLYFEGEDAACKSANIKATLDTLAISFKFGNEATA